MIEKKLEILIVSQYFWPENMRINDLVEGLVERGHRVTVLTGVPNYPEGKLFTSYKKNPQKFDCFKGTKIVRVPMLLRGNSKFKLICNYFTFFISASTFGPLKLRNQHFDIIFVYAVSPIMVAIPAIVLSRIKAAPMFLWVLDLWPETLSAVGAVKNNIALQTVGKVVSWIYNRTDYILIQSKSFKSNILKYCTKPIQEDRLVYFPSWAEDIFNEKKSFTVSSVLNRDEEVFTIMFAGNLGESQDFPTILNAIEGLKDYKYIRLIVIGEGRMYGWMKKQVNLRQLNNVSLLGRHPITEMPGLFACADVLLLSLKTNDVFSKTIPGKLQAYLAAGKPILGIIDGEAAKVIIDSGAGLVSPSGDADALISKIMTLYNLNAEDRARIGKKGVEFYKKNFDSKFLFDQLESFFYTATLRRGTNGQ